jgi:hypothetical protein
MVNHFKNFIRVDVILRVVRLLIMNNLWVHPFKLLVNRGLRDLVRLVYIVVLSGRSLLNELIPNVLQVICW